MISIILPSKDQSEYIAECLDSIRAQTYTDWECIIVDESNDSTPDILKHYEAIDPRFTVIYSKGLGIASSRNLGFNASRGDYICVMDADDVMDGKRLEKSLKMLEKGCDVVYSEYIEMDYKSRAMSLFSIGVIESSKTTLEDIIEHQIAPHATIMARRKCFQDHPYREKRLCDDHYLIATWYKAGYKFKKLRNPVLSKRYHNAQEYRVNYGFYMEQSEKLKEELLKT